MFSDRLRQDVCLGASFFIIYQALNVFNGIQKTITESVEKDDPSVQIDEDFSRNVVYAALFLGLASSPAIIAKTGPKYAMVIGANCCGLYIASFLTEESIWIYLGAALSGFGSSLLWIGQANYIVLNSKIGKVYSAIGVFWIMYQASSLISILIINKGFGDLHRTFDQRWRRRILFKLVACAAVAISFMSSLKSPLRREEDEKITRTLGNETLKTVKLLFAPGMLLLMVAIVSAGIHMTFASFLTAFIQYSHGVTEDVLVNLHVVCNLVRTLGEILGGALSIKVGGKRFFQLRPMIYIAVFCNLACYLVVFLTLPNNSVRFYTSDRPLFVLPTWLLVLAAVSCGVGDAGFQTEIYDILGAMYPNDSSSTFVIFRFVRTIASVGYLYYIRHLGLYVQIAILTTLNISSWVLHRHVHVLVSTTTTPDAENQPEVEADDSIRAKSDVEMVSNDSTHF